MTDEDLVDYLVDPLEEGIFQFSPFRGLDVEVEASGHIWSKFLGVNNPSQDVGVGFLPSGYLLSSPGAVELPKKPFLPSFGNFVVV